MSLSFSQNKFLDNLKITGNYHFGYNLPEYPFISTLTEDYVKGFDFSISKQTTGKNSWEQLYNYPEYGISLMYMDLGNPNVLGKEIALTYFSRIDLYTSTRFNIFNKIGIGISYVDKKYGPISNPLNVAVGSNFNIHFGLQFGGRFELTDKFEIMAGLSFDHYSNGNTSEPNLGINYLTGFTGLSYNIGNKTERTKYDIGEHEKYNIKAVYLGIGGKRTRSLSSNYYVTSSLSFEFERAFFRMVHFGVGFDAFFDSSIKTTLQNDETREYKGSDSFQTGIHISQTLVYNKFSLQLQTGIYLLLKQEVGDYSIYNRGVINYALTDDFSLRIAMKSHLHILDFPELGFGYTF